MWLVSGSTATLWAFFTVATFSTKVPVVADLIAAARLEDRGDDLAVQGADDYGMPRTAQEQFLGSRVERDAARIAGRARVFPDEPLRQWVNDRDGTTRVQLV